MDTTIDYDGRVFRPISSSDNALSGPWMVKKKYTRDSNPRHNWIEEV